MEHPIPTTPDEMIRDTLGVIARAARDIEDTAMQGDMASLTIHYNFLKLQMERLETIKRTMRRPRRNV